VSGRDIPYLIVATDYATTCSGTCPTCVLTKIERLRSYPATTPEKIIEGLQGAAGAYGRVGTLALGIGRANVLDLPEASIGEIGRIVAGAAACFDHEELVVEVSTSLVGKIDRQIARAKAIMEASREWGCDVRFVIVANTALHSEKYWKNVDTFHAALADMRGGAGSENSGDIIQLALSLDSLPEPSELAGRVAGYRSPINLTWAPAFDRGVVGDESLARMEAWIAEWYRLTAHEEMDSSLVYRIRQNLPMMESGMPEAVAHATESSRAVVYVGTDGSWHNGLFTVLAEIDPSRFDPSAPADSVAGTGARDLRKFLTNPACSACEFSGACIASGSHRIGMITLRQFPDGTESCPSGLRAAFASASREGNSNAGRLSHGHA
jgi:hypothetical protein